MSRITLIQFRRDTYANWQTAGSILSLGEAGLDTTNKYLKIGDGSSTPFTSLTNYVYLGSLATAGTYGSTTSVPTLTINADGKLTGVSSVSIPAVTTYTLSSGTNNGTLKLTPSSGTVQDNIAVTGLGSNAYTSTSYAPLSGATFTGAVSGTDLTLSGNLNVQGTQTIINTTNLAVNDSLIYLSDNQYDQDTVDIGIYGAYGFTGGDVNNHKHTGLVRKAGGGWHLVSGGSEPTNNTINLNTVNYDSLKLGNLSFNSNYSLSLGTGTITAINGSGPWVVSVTLSSAPSVLPVVGQYLMASGSQAIGGTNPASPTPYSNPTSVVVSAVTDSTHIQYTVTGGNAPSFGLQNNAQYGAIQGISTLTSAPLYIPSSVIQTDSFYGITKIGAIETSGTTLYFTNNSGTKKTIAFLDSTGYSGTLSKTLSFDSRYFTSDLGPGGSFNNGSSPTISLQDSGTYGSYGDESTIVDGNNKNLGGISPYAVKSPKYVLAGPSTTVQITAVYLNYTTSGAGIQNGYVRYEFSGYAGFTTSAPITVSGTIYSVLNVTLTPTAVVNNPAAANTTGGGYFIFNLTPGTAVSIVGFGANPNTTTGGQARSLTAALTRKPLFRQLNGDDIDLTYAQNFDGINTGGNNLVVSDSDHTLKYMGLAPGSGSAQRQYFLRGDGYWGVPTNGGVQGVVGTNTLAISGADPSPTSATSTLTITPSVTSSYNGNLNLYATGTGVLTIGGLHSGGTTITGGTGGMTITGGTTGANAIGAATSISGVTNTGNGGSAQGGPLNLDGGSGGQNATAGVLNLGLSSSAITLGASGRNITIAGTITGTTTLATGGDANKGLVIKRNSATQSANLQEWSNETGSTTLAAVSASGSFRTSGALATGSLTSIGQLTSVSPSAATVGSVVKGAASQTGDLIQTQNSAGTVLGGTNAFGQTYTGSTTSLKASASVATTAASASSTTVATYTYSAVSQRVAVGQIVNTSGFTAQTYFIGTFVVTAIATVTAGSSYSFTVQGSGFTVASATVQGTFNLVPQATIQAPSDGTTALVIRANSSNQAGNLTEWQDSTGTLQSGVLSNGDWRVNSIYTSYVGAGTGYADYQGTITSLYVKAKSASQNAELVKGAASQTADLVQYQDSTAVVLGGRNAAGQIYTGSTAIKVGQNTTIALTSATGSAGVVTYTSNNASATQPFIAGATVIIGVGLTGGTPSGGFASVTAVIQSVGGSTGAWTFTIANATTGTSTGGTSQAKLSANLAVTATTFANTPIVVQGASSQAASLQEWQSSAGTTLAAVDSAGNMRATGFLNLTTFNNSRLNLSNTGTVIDVGVTTNTVLTVNGAASQTANLQEWQVNGTLQTAVRSDGKLKFSAGNTATTVGATGAASALPALPVGYLQVDIGGTLYKIPYYNN